VRGVAVALGELQVETMLGGREGALRHGQAEAAEARGADRDEEGFDGFGAAGEVVQPLLDEVATWEGREIHGGSIAGGAERERSKQATSRDGVLTSLVVVQTACVPEPEIQGQSRS